MKKRNEICLLVLLVISVLALSSCLPPPPELSDPIPNPEPDPVVAGTGLLGSYFDSTTGTRVVTRIDPTINFNWGTGAPVSGSPNDYFSVVWIGSIRAPISGTYTFSVTVDDGARLLLNNQNILPSTAWRNQAATTYTGTFSMTGGTQYPIRLEYYEATHAASIQLNWTRPDGTTQVVPLEFLYPASSPASQMPQDAATAPTEPTHPPVEEDLQGGWGFTWTQDNVFVSKSEGSDFANIHVYGWGSMWPFNTDGIAGQETDGGTVVSNRVSRALQDGQEIILTACCVPTGLSGGTAWNLDNEIVLEEYEELYAQRMVELLQRHPEIKRVQVWNEMKGYWSSSLQRWDHESYTRFYNKVYNAIKSHDPNIMVGGGYMVFSAKGHGYDTQYDGFYIDSRELLSLTYWMNNADGYDAIILDGYLRQGEFSSLMRYVRSRPYYEGQPIWWAEFYGRDQSMSEAARDIQSEMREGDIALWWAENRYMPYIRP